MAFAVAPSTIFGDLIQINAGETLRESDLLAGQFNGQSFVLGPDLTIDVNDGGAIGPVGTENITYADTPFDFGGATININDGGRLLSGFTAGRESILANAILNVYEGGVVENVTHFHRGAVLNIHGGAVHQKCESYIGSMINLYDGVLGTQFKGHPGSFINVFGGVVEGGMFVQAATLNVFGGDVGSGLRASQGVINVFGGEIGTAFRPVNAVVSVSGGYVDRVEFSGGSAYIAGGEIGEGSEAYSDAFVEISDGIVGDDFRAGSTGAELRVSGGDLGEAYHAESGSVTRLEVFYAFINGVPLELSPTQDYEVMQRSGELLHARLHDGTLIDLVLSSADVPGQDVIANDAQLILDAAIGPACLLYDLNLDGIVNGTDISILLASWGTDENDIDGSGVVDGADLVQVLSSWGPCP